MYQALNVVFSLIFFLFLTFGASPDLNSCKSHKGLGDLLPVDNSKKKKIVLVGASVGGAWNISSLPERIKNYDYMFDYRHGGSFFDKSEEITKVLTQDKAPHVIFLKECAAYFPGDFEEYKKLMKGWIEKCLQAGVIPVPTTVVPVTRLHSFKMILIDIIKTRNPLRFGSPFRYNRNRSIMEYNDWIRAFCAQKGLAVLDLEAAVRYSEKNRFLKENFARIDGLHLNRKAYQALDDIVIPTLESINWDLISNLQDKSEVRGQ
jgi:hypothetical protein